MWEAMQVQKSLKIPFDSAYYWGLHAYLGGPRLLERRIEEYNQAIEEAGITRLELFPPGLNRLGFPKAWKSDS
jgi:hypothetical protein